MCPKRARDWGCVWGDFGNDGFPDLFVTQYGKNVLYHKRGKGTFTDVTDKAGVGGLRVVTGKMSQIREIAGGGGYLSQNDLGTNSGLGKAKRAEIIEIT